MGKINTFNQPAFIESNYLVHMVDIGVCFSNLDFGYWKPVRNVLCTTERKNPFTFICKRKQVAIMENNVMQRKQPYISGEEIWNGIGTVSFVFGLWNRG